MVLVNYWVYCKLPSDNILVKTFRRRYIAFQLNSTLVYSREGILRLLATIAFNQNQKDFAIDMKYIRIINYDEETGLGIIRCNQRLVDVLRFFIMKMPTTSIGLISAKVLGVSGTIKALKKKFLQNAF